MAAQVLEAGLIDAPRNHLAQLAFHAGRRRERRFPVPERAVAVGDRLQGHRRNVALQRHRRLDDAVGRSVVAVRERQQLFADAVAVLQREAADAADLRRRPVAFDAARGDDVVPALMAVEVAQDRPDAPDRRIDHSRADDLLQHRGRRARGQRRPKWRFNASKPPWNTALPICSVSARSRSSAHSNSALHSAKVRAPSVTGVSFSVAT